MPLPKTDLPANRFLAYVVWGSLLFSVLVVGGASIALGPGMRESQSASIPAALPIVAGALNVVLLAVSRFVPRMLKAETPPHAKNIVAIAVCDAGAVFAAVVWMLSGNEHALIGLILGLGGIAACLPNDARWLALGGHIEPARPPEPPPSKRDRSSGPGFGGTP
jgi:hypothetical protein